MTIKMTQTIHQSICDDPLWQYAERVCARLALRLVERIGCGNSASVFKVTASDHDAALKIYQPKFFKGDAAEVERRRVLDQMSLKGHGHTYLIDFYDAGEADDTFYLMMEYFPWRSIDRHLTDIVRVEIAEIISKIAHVAEYLETKGFVHRDIKPANILLSDDCKDLKLLDLGVIRTIAAEPCGNGTDHGYALPFVATAQYSSPAYLFRETPPTEEMWKALTYYQLGGVLHDMLMAHPLFDHEIRTQNRYRVAAAVASSTPNIFADDVPSWLVSLARNCLVKEDRIRLARVSWDSFHADRRRNLDEMRHRLGFRSATSIEHDEVRADRRREERLKVSLDNSREVLIGFCRHVLRKEGFPQYRSRKPQSALAEVRHAIFSFSPPRATAETTHIHFVLQLSTQNAPESHVDLYVGSFLTKPDGEVPLTINTHLVWTTQFSDLEADGDQLISCLSEQFIARYVAAEDELRTFEDGEDVVLEIQIGCTHDG